VSGGLVKGGGGIRDGYGGGEEGWGDVGGRGLMVVGVGAGRG